MQKDYREVRRLVDAGEACWLLAHGWTLLEVQTLHRCALGHESTVTTYILGLPRNACRDVAEISASVLV